MARRAMVAILVMMTLAGCLGGSDRDGEDPSPQPDDDWIDRAMPHQGEDTSHDHTDRTQHVGLSSRNFEIIGWDPMSTERHGTTSGGYYCGETSEMEGRTLAAYESFTTDVALVVMDITDPAAPMLVGELVLPRTHTYDAALADDGSFAVLATNLVDQPDDGPLRQTEPLLLQPVWRDACGNEFQGPLDEAPFASGVVLVDLSDLTSPTVSDYRPQPAIGAHSVSETTIDGTPWIIASTTNLAHGASYFRFYNVLESPIGPLFVEQGTFSSQYPSQDLGGVQSALINGHVDGAIQKHPETGQLLAYLANWNGGMVVVEVTGSGAIVPVSEWRGFGAVHEAYPLDEPLDGRHITIVGQELGGRPSEDRPSGYLALLDTTDPTDPQAVAWWVVPKADLEWQGVGSLGFSTHYPAMHNGTLFVSMYHGGVWAADARPEHWPAMPTLGAFVPDREPPTPFSLGTAPEVLDVQVLADGTLVIPDAASGLYTVRFDRDADVAVVDPLPLEPEWIASG